MTILELCVEIIKCTNPPVYGNVYGPIGTHIPTDNPVGNSDTASIRAAAINIIDKKLSNYIPEVPKRATV